MNRLRTLFRDSPKNLLSVYFTAGFPDLENTLPVMQAIQDGGADIIEVGIPFSDPIADGPTIQDSNKIALDNGMSMNLLFEQLAEMRKTITIPVVLMGYLNPVYRYGIERFAEKCCEIGIDGLILPDMPLEEFRTSYKTIFEENRLSSIFLVTPQTGTERIRMIDELTDSFIYQVSSSSITGAKGGINQGQIDYFVRVRALNLKNSTLIGFGISNRDTYLLVSNYAAGAIIGSAFISMLKGSDDLSSDIVRFIQNIKN